MANEKNQQDELNANDSNNKDVTENYTKNSSGHENSDFRQAEPPKENPFSFKHFLRQDIQASNCINSINGNDINASNGISSSTSPSKSSSSGTTSSLNSSTGARPKIPQFNSVNAIQNHAADSRMKRSPKFSSFDSQSSLSELAEERNNMHGSRSNNCFNTDYQFPSSRSYSNYDIEPSSSMMSERKNIGRRSQSNVNSNTTNSSILPDFVQDHLLMESYYNNNDSPSANMSPLSGDDFSLGNCDSLNHQNGLKGPFELSYSRSPNSSRRRTNVTIPLDLPTNVERQRTSAPANLPPDLMEPVEGVAVQREETYGPHNEPEITRDQAAIDKMQTLPDFLSDGPIHSSGRLADIATISVDEDNQSLIIRLQQENERLRMDVEESRRIIIDLEQQINHAKNLETQYNVTLAESMEQVEENLFASNQRAAEAQVQANKYKQQVKQLTLEIQNLRRENETLREGGAVGGCSNSNISNRPIARELRLAAATAENNLRQLLTGVENLRMIAKSLENTDQYNSSNVDYLSDDTDDNEGPAL
ncbi:hypothetical protein PVAND_005759 [Polypedilum vanderplanki]|uniref:Endosome-associated-trafficking regulator 1 n=1 Tax=Polypedilum vanderplanki TaxID=319348 RepID=A0A9J6C150_POLVA|nr:hypothetical protein PVAND_005759 [Polypedilum vanderplanki]